MNDSGGSELAGEGLLGEVEETAISRPLERGLAILSCFDSEHGVRSLADIADEIGMTCPLTHTYLRVLVELGYLRQDSERRYLLGSHLHGISSATGTTSLREHAYPYLQDLHEQTGLSTGLSVLDGEEIIYLERVGPSTAGWCGEELQLGPGSRLPAYCTAAGKLLMAHLPERERDAVIGQITLTRHGPSSSERRGTLLSELGEIVEDGLAINDEELAPFVQAIAVPIRDDTGDVQAALSLIGSHSDVCIQMLLTEHQPMLQSTAVRISAHLGYTA